MLEYWSLIGQENKNDELCKALIVRRITQGNPTESSNSISESGRRVLAILL